MSLRDRAEISVKRIDRIEADYIKLMRGQYSRLKSQLVNELQVIDGVTMAQAQRGLPRNEQNALIEEMSGVTFERGDTALQKDLTTYQNKPSLTLIDGLFIAITLEMIGIANKQQKGMLGTLAKGYVDKYTYTAYSVALDRGWSAALKPLTNTRLQAVVNSTWKGENLSQRLWSNTKQTADVAKSKIIEGITNGSGTKDIASALRKELDSSQYAAERLVRTEMTRISTEAEMSTYEDLGIEYYIYIATLDERTSEICQTLDGQKFKVSEKTSGINAPPMHPNCRSTTISAETGIQARRARDAYGNTFIVPPNTTYAEYGKQLAEEAKWKSYSEQINSFLQL